MTIAAVVITRNEEHRIRRCLDSLKGWVDEIVVVDDMSVDHTCAIAREYGARIIHHPLNGDFAAQRNRGMAAASSEWILEMDADEAAAPETGARIRSALCHAGECHGFTVRRINCVFDRPLGFPGRCEGVRIARKGKGRSCGVVHETLKIDGPVGKIDADIYHYNLPSIKHALEKNNAYSEDEAGTWLDSRQEVALGLIRRKIIFRTPRVFFKHYIRNKGYKDGPHGLIRSTLNTLGHMVFWLKILERAMKENKLKV